MAFTDALVDRLLRRPRGALARWMWRDMKAHHGIFGDTLRALTLTPDHHLLEIGCGGGTFAARALKTGCRVTAVDHSADMVALATAGNPDAVAEGRLTVVEAAAESLPFPNALFTHAAMMNVVFFLDLPKSLVELRRVLAPQARAVLHTVAPEPPRAVAPGPVARRMRLYADDELRTLLDDAGFTDIRITRVDSAYQLVTAVAP
ncbi:MAG: class I SAM-dependent methyltransferase [Mycobacteriaceae bacterium]|nr:class I SAM-dependent methyltransferase [Mycobacteriaceae bacterium]